MALGVTQQLPIEERHIYRQDYIEDRLVVAMGGRIAEDIVYGVISTGANNDLVMSTELARKMVREWGMSSRIGPMAWGSQGQVFLGEDLMHTRDYSDETARVIDEEVEKILREQEDRCRVVLGDNRHGLDLVARALMEHETIDGAEVKRLIEIGRTGAPIESVVTRGADETRFSQPSPAAAAGNGGNGSDQPSPSPAPAITNTPPS
jgi:cell division protease FtsH